MDPVIIEERDKLFLERVQQPLSEKSVHRQYVKHAPHNLTVGRVLQVATEAHPDRICKAFINSKGGITLKVMRNS